MRQPRVMRNPNGGILNVDVSYLHRGLSQCRGIAENALTGAADEAALRRSLEQIATAAMRAMHEVVDYEMLDEVAAVLSEESE